MPRRPRDDPGERVARLYDRLGPALYRYALMILADPAAAEDAVQDVFVAVLRERDRAIDDDDAYLYRAVRNACYSALRKRRVRASEAPLVEPVADTDPSETDRLALEDAIRALPPDQCEVLHLKVFDGRTLREIADLTGESINTIASRYRYAIDKLRSTYGVSR